MKLKKLKKRLKRLMSVYRDSKDIAILKTKGSEYKERIAKYAEYYNKQQIDEKTILYESFFGRGINDNPYAIFKHIISDGSFSDYQHIWVVDEFDEKKRVIQMLKDRYANIHFILKYSDEYLRALAKAKYLINNSTFPPFFTKKKDQVYVNTWHGTPLKKMGYDIPNGRLESGNVVRNFLSADYLIAANEIMTKMYLESYRMEGIFPGQLLQTGYPRNDVLINGDRDEIITTLIESGVKVDKAKEIILYAPTWRGTAETTKDDADRLQHEKSILLERLDSQKYQLLVKPHQMLYERMKQDGYDTSSFVPSYIDTNELLSVTDILIADYSSIFLDYMLSNRPIFFYIPDFESYKEERGIDAETVKFPGPVSYDIDTLVSNLSDADSFKINDDYKHLRDEIAKYEDGNATKRIVDCIWRNQEQNFAVRANNEKKKLLISGAHTLENGITYSLISLTKRIDYDEWDVTIVLEPGNRTQRVKEMIDSEFDSRARVIARKGTFSATRNEEIKRNIVMKYGCFNKHISKLYPEELYKREWRRMFGDASFDYIVDFNGYAVLYTPVLLCGEAKTHSIWLHSDIKSDMNRTVNGEKPLKEKLRFIASLYPRFDNLVSCAKTVRDVNKKKLGNEITNRKFKYAKNTVNIDRIRKSIEDEQIIDIMGKQYLIADNNVFNKPGTLSTVIPLPEENDITFVTMGRLSTEKNHANLIHAFKQFHDTYANSVLYIIGNGPLKNNITNLIREAGLEESVHLTWNIANPFSIMKRCSCFILPSFYEGQPMVLLEARMCDLPIIVSDFESVKDSIYPDGQLLIHTDAESIYEGMLKYAKGEVPVAPFSDEKYNQEAYQEFIEAIQ